MSGFAQKGTLGEVGLKRSSHEEQGTLTCCVIVETAGPTAHNRTPALKPLMSAPAWHALTSLKSLFPVIMDFDAHNAKNKVIATISTLHAVAVETRLSGQ